MSLQAMMSNSGSKHRVKVVAGAAVLLTLWLFLRIPSDQTPVDLTSSSLPLSAVPAGAGSPYHVTEGASVPATIGGGIAPAAPYDPKAPHKDALSTPEAQELCSRYRLRPFPRHRNPRRKVYDLLLINGELDTLEMRLGQMSSYVDYFVIMESNRTFNDHKKPLHLQENWGRFEPWHRQMIRRTMDLPLGFSGTSERASRNRTFDQVIPYLSGEQEAFQDDVLLVSDIDEFFKPETVKVLRNCEFPVRTTARSNTFYYSFQWLGQADWPHPQATVYRAADTVPLDGLRDSANDYVFPSGAWHCRYCFGTAKELRAKIESLGTPESKQPQFKDPETLAARVRAGVDVFDRANFTRIENNRDVPDYVSANADKYRYMLDRDPPSANFADYNVPPEGERLGEGKVEGS